MNNKDNIYLFREGTHLEAYNYFGSHILEGEVVFRVYAPNAKEMYLVGEFNGWDKSNPMRKIDDAGVWELAVKGLNEYDSYKYLVVTKEGWELYKSDPYGFHFETRPGTATKIYNLKGFKWEDSSWILSRDIRNIYEGPLNIYEVHAGSFRKGVRSYKELKESLIPYVKEMGYSHIELMPLTEYPYDPSWGYQVIGYYGVTSRYGTPKDLMDFVNSCHKEGIGVIIDWVPAHFPKDETGLYRWDGSHLYEYYDELKRYHQSWGTAVFDYGKKEVRSFLLSNALFWIKEFHVDGIRTDAVSSMLYLDYNRQAGQWRPNVFGGKENLEAIEFLKDLNSRIKAEEPNCLLIAEESTAWPGVTKPVFEGGLGFDYKWNMGWMNDTLKYLSMDGWARSHNPNLMTFPISYAYSEKYILALSHDEVVHMKGSLLSKIPGSQGDKLRQLRTYLGYVMAHPGKKLLFMGGELADTNEWDFQGELSWHLLESEDHKSFKGMVKELNNFYNENPCLWSRDSDFGGFEWLNVERVKEGLVSFIRYDNHGNSIIVLSNFLDRPADNIYMPGPGKYNIVFNTSGREEAVLIREDGVYLEGFTTAYIKKEV